WIDELSAAGRVVRAVRDESGRLRWFAVEATREPKAVLRGRLEALGPVLRDADDRATDGLFLALEAEGIVLRTRIGGREAWCDRRLLARIQRATLERLRREIEPVTAAQFLRYLACWQHVDPEHQVEGPLGVALVIAQLAGFEVPAAAWEGSILPARVRAYRREWLDQLTLSGEIAWMRLWGSGGGPVRRTPICLLERAELDSWSALSAQQLTQQKTSGQTLSREPAGTALAVYETLVARGAMFFQELARVAKLPPAFVEAALAELIALGRVTCDSFGGLRWLIVPAGRRRVTEPGAGRWCAVARDEDPSVTAEFVARRLLARTGVVFRRTAAREKQPFPWRDIVRALRTLEARGEVRGGRFVSGFDGEQYALPEAVALLRSVRRRGATAGDPRPVEVSAADPLNYRGILTPDERIASTARGLVLVA
ncbi:MAG: ATP-dependent DNA helicase, partial [Thermoanaerobaculia bacterium]